MTPVIKANSFLYTYYRQFHHLYIDPSSHLIQYYTPNSRVFEEIFIKTQLSINQTRICLPFKLFNAAFSKTHSHGHSGEKRSIKTFNQVYFIRHLPLWFAIFIHDCIECQTNKHFPIKPQNISPLFLFMRVLLISTTGSPWTIKALVLHLLKTTSIFLSSLMHSVTLLLLTQLLTLLRNMPSELFSIIGSPNLVPLNIFSIPILVYLSPFLLTYLVIFQKIVSQLIVSLFPFIHIIAPKTLIPSSTHSLINLSPHGF